MTARLAAEGVAWAAAGRFVLLDADLALQAGEVAALLGANGVGKTSLLDVLAGDRPPDRGRVLLDGRPLDAWSPATAATRIARLGHRPGLYLDLTAAENLQLFGALAGRPLTDDDAARELAAVGLQPADGLRPVRTWSRGMQQRAALARVQASPADVWLLDEPSTGLDGDGLSLLCGVLAEARGRGVAVLCATHDPALVAACDRRWRLDRGRLEAA